MVIIIFSAILSVNWWMNRKWHFSGCFVRSDIIICNNWNSYENKMLVQRRTQAQAQAQAHNEMHAMKRASILWSTSIKLELLTFFVFVFVSVAFGILTKKWENRRNRIIWWCEVVLNGISFLLRLCEESANCTATKMRFDFVVIQYGRNFKWM